MRQAYAKRPSNSANWDDFSRRPDERIPPPSTKAATIENDFQKNISGGLPNLGQLSLKPRHPIRPGYGTRGEQVVLFANYMELVTAPDLVLHRYSVQIKVIPSEKPNRKPVVQEPVGKKLARVIKLMLELPEYDAVRDHMVTDFKSTLICRKRLSQDESVYQIQYRSEGEDTARQDAPTYRLTVTHTGVLTVAQLTAFLMSSSIDLAYTEKEPTIQALNIIRGYFPKVSPLRTTIGTNKSFSLQNPDTKSLGAGLEAIRGFWSSVRVAASRILVNINVTHAPFYKALPLVDVVREYRAANRDNVWKTEKFLKMLRVRVVHIPEKKNKAGRSIPRVKTIWGLANVDDGRGGENPPKNPPQVSFHGAGAKDVKFFLNETGTPSSSTPGGPTGGKDGGKKKGKGKLVTEPSGEPSSSGGSSQGRYISVYDHFKRNYPNHPIKNLNLPVVNVGNRKDPSYLPLEVCVVEPGQSSTSKLTPLQTKDMIAFAVRKPWMNADSITRNGPGTVGLLQQVNPMLASFGISTNGELVTVPGRVLPAPKVNYKNKPAEVKDGSWNMMKVKFNATATLRAWTTVVITEKDTPSDFDSREAFESTINNLFKALREVGINASPAQPGPARIMVNDASDFPKLNDVFTDWASKRLELAFIVLPSGNSPAYDYIKTIADTRYGIHTICSVGSKLVNESNQYFNNVALKFNLKLGGVNQIIDNTRLGVINEGKTMVIGIDVTHPSPGSADNAPSVAGMVASVDKLLGQWPATLRVQEKGKAEMVAELDGMLKSRLLLWRAKNRVLPDNLLIYRDGVSEGQYNLVLDEELPLLRKACKEIYPPADTKKNLPNFTIVICGKRHHTRFYSSNLKDTDKSSNPKNGTVVDRGVTEPSVWDFYLQAHTALQGTARSCHYIVVLDEILRKRPLSALLGHRNVADVLEDMTYCMCHLFGRATKTVSLCPPAKYADLVCERARKYLSGWYDMSSPSHTQAGSSVGASNRAAKNSDVEIHPKLRDTMFYL